MPRRIKTCQFLGLLPSVESKGINLFNEQSRKDKVHGGINFSAKSLWERFMFYAFIFLKLLTSKKDEMHRNEFYTERKIYHKQFFFLYTNLCLFMIYSISHGFHWMDFII